VKYEMPENVGPYPVRNKAFELTETPYHLYLDGDDLLMPDAVENVLRAFAARPEADFVYGDYEYFGPKTYVHHFRRQVVWDDFTEGQPIPGACAYKKALWTRL